METKESEERKVKERKQITLRLPDKVYGALRAEAENRGYSINELIIFTLREAVGFASL